tara:strand:- start:40 stop:789 length:750 start_codon:yes stop_codon:yes gene_type:complete
MSFTDYVFMCTVTIIPKGDKDFVLTSNRDEAPSRIALAPDFYTIEHTRLLYPKDECSGGTWIGLSDKNRLVCLLNGGFELHQRKETYRLSRGVVVKDFLISHTITTVMQSYNLEDIEPFTMVIVDWNSELKFYELIWDGSEKYISKLPLEPKLWSSSTLYSQPMKIERKAWFESYKKDHELNAKSLMQFHKTAGKNNDEYGVIMNRGFVKTMSITQVEKTGEDIKMTYENLSTNIVTTKQFKTPQIINE